MKHKVVTTILGVPFHYVLKKNLLELFDKLLEKDDLTIVFTPNPEILLHSEKDFDYKKYLQESHINLPDGAGLLWASSFQKRAQGKGALGVLIEFVKHYMALVVSRKYLTNVIPEVVQGSNTFFTLHELFQKRGTRVLYLGGEQGVERDIAKVMQKQYPKIIAQSIGGYPFKNKEDASAITDLIRSFHPEVVFVAMEFPKQETWIMQHKNLLKESGVKVAMVVGGTFDVAVGKKRKPPKMLQRSHLEWLYRLIIEPSRWKRIINAVVIFPLHIWRDQMKHK